jgi:hypothetical protein
MTINNMIYMEGAVHIQFDHNEVTPLAGGTTWDNGDMMDIYGQARTPQWNDDILIADNYFHGLRSPSSTAHPDTIQTCNSDCGGTHVNTNIKIFRNVFEDQECASLRISGDHDQLDVEQNVFHDTVQGISGCGYYQMDIGAADATVKYNTFVGDQSIQGTAAAAGSHPQTWVGNIGNGFDQGSGCGGGGRGGGVFRNNVWRDQKCSTTDKQVVSLKLNTDGTLQSGSPGIDAGDSGDFPSPDKAGNTRYVGLGPDAGAFEFGATGGGGGGTTNPVPGDVNGDGHVGIVDLSLILSNFGKTTAQASNPNCDQNSDGKVTIIDLSVVLSKYGT